MKNENKCPYCVGLGEYAEYNKIGLRRTMEMGVRGKPMHPRERIDPCRYCGKPEAGKKK